MKKAKIVKTHEQPKSKIVSESYSIKKLIEIILIILIVFAIFYFITTVVVKPSKDINKENAVTQIDTAKIILNSSLLQVNYYQIYKNYINDYTKDENSLKFYIVDLNDALNKSYLSDSANITNTLSELKINDDTLFKIINGKISEYYIGSEKIISALSSL